MSKSNKTPGASLKGSPVGCGEFWRYEDGLVPVCCVLPLPLVISFAAGAERLLFPTRVRFSCASDSSLNPAAFLFPPVMLSVRLLVLLWFFLFGPDVSRSSVVRLCLNATTGEFRVADSCGSAQPVATANYSDQILTTG